MPFVNISVDLIELEITENLQRELHEGKREAFTTLQDIIRDTLQRTLKLKEVEILDVDDSE